MQSTCIYKIIVFIVYFTAIHGRLQSSVPASACSNAAVRDVKSCGARFRFQVNFDARIPSTQPNIEQTCNNTSNRHGTCQQTCSPPPPERFDVALSLPEPARLDVRDSSHQRNINTGTTAFDSASEDHFACVRMSSDLTSYLLSGPPF